MAQIEVIGNGGGDAELKFIKGARGDFAIANLSLAETPRKFKDGEWIEGETVWWKVSATGQLAEWMADTSLKGVKLLVKGELKQFEYTGRDGNAKQGFEIQAKVVAIVGGLKQKSNNKPQQQEDSWPF